MGEAGLLGALASEIHVWFADIRAIPADCLLAHFPLLDAPEQARCQRFHFEKDRLNYLAAHAMLRLVLSRYAPLPPAQWRFSAGPFGKPEIVPGPDLPPLRFNLTHTQGMVACVIALQTDCGIDVESIHRTTDMRGVAQSVFSAAEIAYLERQPVSEWPQKFFSLWTLKEAYIKATGQGFSAPLGSISLDISQAEATVTHADHEDDGNQWLLHLSNPRPSFQLAVAARTRLASNAIVYRALDLASAPG